jgi:hypothetical protein
MAQDLEALAKGCNVANQAFVRSLSALVDSGRSKWTRCPSAVVKTFRDVSYAVNGPCTFIVVPARDVSVFTVSPGGTRPTRMPAFVI